MNRNGRTRPSVSALILLLVLLAALAGAMNYGNNMAFFLTFLLFSLGLVDLFLARLALTGLSCQEIACQPVFAPGTSEFTLNLIELKGRQRNAVFLAAHLDEPEFSGPWTIPASGRISLSAAKNGLPRGRHSLPGIILLTFSPLGFFTRTRFLPMKREFYVYPAPAGNQPWPPSKGGLKEHGLERLGGEDFTGFKRYRPGEPQQHIDWKGVAKGRPPLVKLFSGGGDRELWFSWQDTAQKNPEERLSQLSKWIVEADRNETGFGLELPELKVAAAAGVTHTHHCLALLAAADTRHWK